MNHCKRLTAFSAASCGILALIFSCIALSLRNWEIETNIDYFRSPSNYPDLRLSRIMSIFSLIFTSIGTFTSLLMITKHLWKYWNLVAPGCYLLASLTHLLSMCEASRIIHHNGWPSYIYAAAFVLLVIATQLISILAGKIIFSYRS